MKQINRNTFAAIILAVAFLAFSSVSSYAATFVVNTTTDTQDAAAGDGNCADAVGACSLRAAISEANAFAGADIITLPAGTYTITIAEASDNANLNGDFDLLTEITINGAGPGSTIVQANAARGVATGRVFHLRAAFPMALNGMTVRYGRYTTAAGTFGAGIRVDTAAVVATFTDLTVTENDDGTSGGGIAVSAAVGAIVTINNCTVSNNTAGGTLAGSSTGAGIMGNVTTARIDINNSTVTGNVVSNTSTTVSPIGGGVTSIGTLNITNSNITGNTSTSSGFNAFTGGVHVSAGTATITGSLISGNMATITAGTGAAIIGGLYNQSATVSLINSTVTGNSVSNAVTPATAFHAGVRVLSLTIVAVTSITNSTISNNTAGGEGGGVVNISGGAANATTNITGSTISGNTVTSATGVGGGLEQFTTSTGLAVINVTNSTVSGNSAANGAGSWNTGATSTINYNFATVASNTAATAGGGLFQAATGVTNLKNSIVADNTSPSGPDISGTITSQDYNHVEDVTGGTFLVSFGSKETVATNFLLLPNDVTGTDPALTPLGNNGGSTQTHVPGLTSPVVNTIPNAVNDCGTVITVDQRNSMRPIQTGCEKGSVERFQPTAAGVDVAGRVLTAEGAGLRNAIVTLTDSRGVTRTSRSSSFGNYSFEDVRVGETYILGVNSKRYVFTPRTIQVLDEVTGLDITADAEQ